MKAVKVFFKKFSGLISTYKTFPVKQFWLTGKYTCENIPGHIPVKHNPWQKLNIIKDVFWHLWSMDLLDCVIHLLNSLKCNLFNWDVNFTIQLSLHSILFKLWLCELYCKVVVRTFHNTMVSASVLISLYGNDTYCLIRGYGAANHAIC